MTTCNQGPDSNVFNETLFIICKVKAWMKGRALMNHEDFFLFKEVRI